MSSSRYRDERSDSAYPPRRGLPSRDYYPSPSSSRPYDSREPQYASSSAYPSRALDNGSRFPPSEGGGGGSSRSRDDRGYSGWNHANTARHDSRSDRNGRDDRDDRGTVRDGRGADDYRTRSPPLQARSLKPRDDDRNRMADVSTSSRFAQSSQVDPRAQTRVPYRDLSPPVTAPTSNRIEDDASAGKMAPPLGLGKASYERAPARTTTRSPAATTNSLPQSSPGVEPGEIVTPIDPPPVSSSRVDGDAMSKWGNSEDRNRGDSGRSRQTSGGSHSLGKQRLESGKDSRYGRDSEYPPPSSYPAADSRNSRNLSPRRGMSPPRSNGSSALRPSSIQQRDRSPPRQSDGARHSSSTRRLRSPEQTQRRRSASPPSRRALEAKGKETFTRRGRSPTRSPRSRSRSLTISPPPKTRRRRRGSSCSSASRSPSPTRSRRHKPVASSSDRRRPSGRRRSHSRSPRSRSQSVTRSNPRSRSTSQSPRAATKPKLDKRPRSPETKSSDRAFDKKAKVTKGPQPSNDVDLSRSTTSTIASSMSSSQRAALPLNPSRLGPLGNSTSYSAPAPTAPRALRPTLSGQTNANLLNEGGRVTVEVPKGPKTKAGFAPIKTTQVAGPPTTSQPSIVPSSTTTAKVAAVKKFFPGEDEEEEEREERRKSKDLKAKEEKERFEGERGRQRMETERDGKERASKDSKGKDRYEIQDRMNLDEDDRHERSRLGRRTDQRHQHRSRSVSRSRSNSSRSTSRTRSRSRNRSRSRSRRRSRSRSRSRSVGRTEDRRDVARNERAGWTVRNQGEVPPPRVRSLHDHDDDIRTSRQPLPVRAQQVPLGSRNIASQLAPAGPRRFNHNAVPTGPSNQARVPASYERPAPLPSFGGPRHGFNAVTSANAVVPGVSERKWGAPNSIQTPTRPLLATPMVVNGTPSSARPSSLPNSTQLPPRFPSDSHVVKSGWSQPPSAPRDHFEAGTPPLGSRPSLPHAPAPVLAETSAPIPSPQQPPVKIPSVPPEPSPAVPTHSIESSSAPNVESVAAQPTEFYERIVQVGEGTYGKVYKARNVETGELVALKRIRMEAEKDGFPITAVREIKLLQNLRHPNVVDLKEMLVSKGHVYMVMEYMDHDLTGILHHPNVSFSPAHLKSLMKQFLEGLDFIHRRGVLHRDLKGSNILLSRSGELRIADFGLARFFARGRNNDYTNRVITQWYKPPELLFGATIYGEEVDMWSAGCIFLELFARRPVFQGQDEIHQLEVIFKVTGTPSPENWPGVQDLPWYELVKPRTSLPSQLRSVFCKWMTPAGLDVAERLLCLDPAGRPTAAAALQMDYFESEEPKPEPPDFLSSLSGSWHEFESKRARRKAREDAA
ncbi:uncharacterized protein JCM6883_007120 [Sporobolomyces salmoneus]|uniref:uncharacterized protein n=1 Tax=Sporobolomyces salmoneus TaxID=183962 RepID=UPI00316D48CE